MNCGLMLSLMCFVVLGPSCTVCDSRSVASYCAGALCVCIVRAARFVQVVHGHGIELLLECMMFAQIYNAFVILRYRVHSALW